MIKSMNIKDDNKFGGRNDIHGFVHLESGVDLASCWKYHTASPLPRVHQRGRITAENDLHDDILTNCCLHVVHIQKLRLSLHLYGHNITLCTSLLPIDIVVSSESKFG